MLRPSKTSAAKAVGAGMKLLWLSESGRCRDQLWFEDFEGCTKPAARVQGASAAASASRIRLRFVRSGVPRPAKARSGLGLQRDFTGIPF